MKVVEGLALRKPRRRVRDDPSTGERDSLRAGVGGTELRAGVSHCQGVVSSTGDVGTRRGRELSRGI